MSSASGDRYSIRIGRDAYAPVVAGHDNVVETPPAQSEPIHEDEDRALGASQRNSAKDHGTVFAVTHGDMHIYRRDDDSEKPEP